MSKQVQKIKAEIERQIEATESSVTACILADILRFIDSVQKEPGCEDLEEFATREADEFAEWEHASKFDAAIQEGDEVKYNEDLGCRINLSQLNRVARKPSIFNMLGEEECHCVRVGEPKEATGVLGDLLKGEASKTEMEYVERDDEIKSWTKQIFEECKDSTFEFDWDDMMCLLRDTANHFCNWQKEQNMKHASEWLNRNVTNPFESGVQYGKEQLINKACEWLNIHDSYSTPTNVKVLNFRKAMED